MQALIKSESTYWCAGNIVGVVLLFFVTIPIRHCSLISYYFCDHSQFFATSYLSKLNNSCMSQTASWSCSERELRPMLLNSNLDSDVLYIRNYMQIYYILCQRKILEVRFCIWIKLCPSDWLIWDGICFIHEAIHIVVPKNNTMGTYSIKPNYSSTTHIITIVITTTITITSITITITTQPTNANKWQW